MRHISITVFILSLFTQQLWANNGTNCSESTPLEINSTCNYTAASFDANSINKFPSVCGVFDNSDRMTQWFHFTAKEKFVNLSFETNSFFEIGLFEECDGVLIDCFKEAQPGITVSYSFQNLEPGKKYYIQLNAVYGFSIPTVEICLSDYQLSNSDCAGANIVCSNENISFSPNGAGLDDSRNATEGFGCLGSEHLSAWYQFKIDKDAPNNLDLAFKLTPNEPNSDYDFALFDGNSTCGNFSAPIRCSIAGEDGVGTNIYETGLAKAANDLSEDENGDGFVKDIIVEPGAIYYLLINNYDGKAKSFSMEWTGEAANYLECDFEQPNCNSFINDPRVTDVQKAYSVCGEYTVAQGQSLNIKGQGHRFNDNQTSNAAVALAFFKKEPTSLNDYNLYSVNNPDFIGFEAGFDQKQDWELQLYNFNGVISTPSFELKDTVWAVEVTLDYYNKTTGQIKFDEDYDNCFSSSCAIKIVIEDVIDLNCGDSFEYESFELQPGQEQFIVVCPDNPDENVEIHFNEYDFNKSVMNFYEGNFFSDVNLNLIQILGGSNFQKDIFEGTLGKCISIGINSKTFDTISWSANINCYNACPDINAVPFFINPTHCSLDTIEFSAPVTAGLSYLWNVPDGSEIISGQDSNVMRIILPANPNQEVCLQVKADCGARNTFCQTIQINEPTVPTFDLNQFYCPEDLLVSFMPNRSKENLLGQWTVAAFVPKDTSSFINTFTPDVSQYCVASVEHEINILEKATLSIDSTVCVFEEDYYKTYIKTTSSIKASRGNVSVIGNGYLIDRIPFGVDVQITLTDVNSCSNDTLLIAPDCTPPCSPQATFSQSKINCIDSLTNISFGEAFGGVKPYFYSINDGVPSFIKEYSDLEAGTYSFKIQDKNQCKWDTTVVIDPIIKPVINYEDVVTTTGIDNILTPKESINAKSIVNLTFEPAINITCLSEDCLEASVRIKETTDFVATLVDTNFCTAVDSFQFKNIDDELIYIPNIIKYDSKNSRLFAQADVPVEHVSFEVYDRWGGLINVTQNININNYSEGWDVTTVDGKRLPTGVYMYRCTAYFFTGQTKEIFGEFVIVN